MTIEEGLPPLHVATPTVADESANVLTHAIGLLLGIPAAAVLLVAADRSADSWLFVGCVIYASTMVALYAASTLSHLFHQTPRREFFRRLDQACIYLFIVGTYTPFSLGYLRTGPGWLLLALMWTIALVGFLAKIAWGHRVDATTTWGYIALGWLPSLAVLPLSRVLPSPALWWMLFGGLSYTLGVGFLKNDTKIRYFHALWHVSVLAGTAWHYFAILLYVVPGG